MADPTTVPVETVAEAAVEVTPSEQLSSELDNAVDNPTNPAKSSTKSASESQTAVKTSESTNPTGDIKASEKAPETRFNGDRRGRGSYRGRGQNGGHHPHRPRTNNAKSDLTSQPESSDPEEIRKQVEFYFADSNLPMDKFLFEKVQGHRNTPVPLTLIHSFRRMRHFKPFSAIVEALKESTVLELADGDTTVRRKIPIAEELCGSLGEIQKVFNDKTMPQSVYVKGFGEETSTTQFDLERFFEEFGSVNAVRLRRTLNDRTFKGSVFVEFKDEDTAKAFLNLDPQPKWNGKDLLIKPKKQYCDEKIDEINAKRAKGSADKDLAAKDNWKKRREAEQKNGSNRGGRGGRGGRGHRGGRGRGGHRPNHGDDSKRGDKSGKVDYRGVPMVASTEEPSEKEEKAATAEMNLTKDTAREETSQSKKRPHDDESESQNAAKKEKLAEQDAS